MSTCRKHRAQELARNRIGLPVPAAIPCVAAAFFAMSAGPVGVKDFDPSDADVMSLDTALRVAVGNAPMSTIRIIEQWRLKTTRESL
jgi:hypothetical protein